MPSNETKRNGTERAAILLLSLGEQEAAEVMKHMGAKDVQRIGAAMTQLQNISRKEVSAGAERVHHDGREPDVARRRRRRVPAQGADRRARRRQGRAASSTASCSAAPARAWKRSSGWIARAVAELIRQEHPQIIAIVLAYLDAGSVGRSARAVPGVAARRRGHAHRDARRHPADGAARARRSDREAVRRQDRRAQDLRHRRREDRREHPELHGLQPGRRAGRADPQGRRSARQQDPGSDVRVRRPRRRSTIAACRKCCAPCRASGCCSR